ncbi:hypothetical protein AURDEDRAFT_114165 [Auricularia subglabra TFB-10046 SS5]|nr:hypothetical protein AURDEDRAFT_114165 [Auricularia subglabra TFB-10046 SS5]
MPASCPPSFLLGTHMALHLFRPPPLDLGMWLCKSCQNAVFLACFAQPPPLALASTRSPPRLRLMTLKLHCLVIPAPRRCIHGPCQDSGRVFGFREGVVVHRDVP